MSGKELERLEILKQLEGNTLTPCEASIRLQLSTHQVRNLRADYRKEGPKALISKKRGKSSNHRHPEDFKRRVLELVKDCYLDFGPTLAAEKLLEVNDLHIGVETLRQWMIGAKIWSSRRAKQPFLHPLRARRK